MTETITAITDGQKKQIRRLAEDAVERALQTLDKDAAQRLIERGDEFQEHIGAAAEELSVGDQFADEEGESNYAYPPEYKGPRLIAEQIAAIAKIFDLDPVKAFEYAKQLPALPEGAEGWFAVPSVDAIAAKHFPKVTDPVQKYCQAVQLVHQKIAESRSFYNYREGQITPAKLRVHARTAHALDLIAETQKGDILIVAAQLGKRHRGKSVRRAREVFVANEFGLGSLAVGSIVLTHPERLVRREELDMDCTGDEFSPDADGSFARAPYFFFNDVKVRFDSCVVSYVYEDFGSASGFLPK